MGGVRKYSKITYLCSISLFVTVLFTGCENFLGGQDVKDDIISAIEYNNAPTYTIKITEIEGSGQLKTPVSGEVIKKVTDSFTVKFSPASTHQFMYWEAVVGDLKEGETVEDYIHFADSESLETTVTLKKASSQITIRPVCPEKLVVNFNNSDSTILYPCDTTIQLSFNKPVAAGCENNIGIRIPDIPSNKTGLDYFKTPVVENNKITFFAKVIDGDYSDRIPVPASGKIVAVTLKASDFYYVNNEYSKPVKVYLQEDRLFSYTISQETSEKTEAKYTVDNNATAAGNYRVDDVDLGGQSEKYSVGTTINLKYQLIEYQDYKFAGWSFAYAEPNSTTYTSVATDQLASLNIGISYPEHEDTFGYDPITHTAQALVTIYNYKGGLIYVSPNVVPVPKTDIWIDGSNGKLSPGKGKHTVREGEESTISFEPDGDYDFLCWKVYNGNTLLSDYSNYIQIEHTDEAETVFKLLAVPSDTNIKLTIKPEVIERPQVISATPIYDAIGAYRDARVQVVFDHAMDINCIYYSKDEVEAIKADFDPDNPKDKMLAVDEEDPDTKYFGYVKDGNYVFKNIQIKNNKTQKNLLSCFNAPEFDEDLKVLSIPAKKGDAAPAGGSTILVEIGKNFSFKEETTDKPINMREAKKWIYFVNSKTDTIAPEVSSVKIIDSLGSEIKQNTATNYLTKAQKLKFQVEATDTGSGPAGYFEIVFQNSAHSAIRVPFERVEGASAYCGDTSNDKNEYYTFDLSEENIADGDYSFSLKFYDQNKNDGIYKSSSTSTGVYTIKIDTTAPSFTTKTLAASLNSSDSSKSDITLTYKVNDTDFTSGKLYYRQAVSKANRTVWEDWTGVTTFETLSTGNTEKTVSVTGLPNSKTYELKAVLTDTVGNEESYVFKKNTIPAADPSAIKCEVDNVVNTISITPNGSDADANSYEIIKMEDLKNDDSIRYTRTVEELAPIQIEKTYIIKNKVYDTCRYNLYVKGTNNEAISDRDYANNGCSYINANPNETVLNNILTKPKGVLPFGGNGSELKFDYDNDCFKFYLPAYYGPYGYSSNKYGIKISYAPYNTDGSLGDYSSGIFTDDFTNAGYITIPYTGFDASKLYNFKIEPYFYTHENLCVEGKAQYIDANKSTLPPPMDDFYPTPETTLQGDTVLLTWTPMENVDIDYYLIRVEQDDSLTNEAYTISTIKVDKDKNSCLLALPKDEEEGTSCAIIIDAVKNNKFYEAESYSLYGSRTIVSIPGAHSGNEQSEPSYYVDYCRNDYIDFEHRNIPVEAKYIAYSTDYDTLKDETKRKNANYKELGSGSTRLSNLDEDTFYYIAITDKNTGDINLVSDIFAGTTTTYNIEYRWEWTYYKVKGLKAELSEDNPDTITLSWTKPDRPYNDIKVSYRRPEISNDWQEYTTVSKDSVSCVVTGLADGYLYDFKLTTKNYDGDDFSRYISARTPKIIMPEPMPVLDKAISFTATPDDGNCATLNWQLQNNSYDIDYYRIYNQDWDILVDNIPKTTTNLLLICIPKQLDVFVAGCKNDEPVVGSNNVNIPSTALPYYNIIAASYNYNTITLNFDDNSDYDDPVRNNGYQFYYKKNSDTVWTGPVVPELDSYYSIKGLEAGTKYDIKIVTKGNSDYTDSIPAIVSAYTLPNPVIFDNDNVSTTTDTITVNWTNPEGPYYKTVFQYMKQTQSDNVISGYDPDWTDVLTIFYDDVDKPDSYTFTNLLPSQGYRFRWKTFPTIENSDYNHSLKRSDVIRTNDQ